MSTESIKWNNNELSEAIAVVSQTLLQNRSSEQKILIMVWLGDMANSSIEDGSIDEHHKMFKFNNINKKFLMEKLSLKRNKIELYLKYLEGASLITVNHYHTLSISLTKAGLIYTENLLKTKEGKRKLNILTK